MRAVTVALFLALSACPPPSPAGPRLTGEGWSLTPTDEGGLRFARGDTTLVTLPLDAFQLGTVRALEDDQSYDPYWLVVKDPYLTATPPQGFRWRAATAASVAMEGAALVLSLTFPGEATATVRATVAPAGHLQLHFVPGSTTTPVAYLRLRATTDASEAYYGLGEWFDAVNHRGTLRPMQVEVDLSTESGTTENHVSIPFLVGSRGWGLFVETHRHGVFDVARTTPDVVDSLWGTAEASSEGLVAHLFAADRALDIPLQYYRVTGFPRPPAPWATGPWIWRNESRDQAEVEDDVRQLRALDLATSALWIDRPYASDVNTFDYDPARYPDAGAMVERLHAAGLRLALWHTPYLAPGAAPFRAEAVDAGYFPPEQGALFNRWSAPLDFTRPEVVTSWVGLLHRYTEAGVEGFKLDFAEDVAAGIAGKRSGWRFANGETDRTMQDGYPRRYHAVYREALGGADGFHLVRVARWGEHQHGVVVWPGDIDATLTRYGERFTSRDGESVVGVGGLPSALRAGVGLSMSGLPFFASDTGGYRHSPPDRETWLRWVAHAALMPVMQTGDDSSQPPWVFTAANGRDEAALEVYRQFARLHLRLFPFFWSHVQRMAVDGRPVVRPFGVQWPETGQHPEDAYALGDELFVAPVETAGATSRSLVKPPGRWFSWWDGAELAGEAGAPQVVAAPVGTLPLFVREGALVPLLRPTIDTLSPATDPEVDSYANDAGDLWVRVVPALEATRFECFDGTVLEQQGGAYTATAGSRFTRRVVWELRGAPRPTSVEHDGAALLEVGSEVALRAADAGYWFGEGVLQVKAPLDGRPTRVQ